MKINATMKKDLDKEIKNLDEALENLDGKFDNVDWKEIQKNIESSIENATKNLEDHQIDVGGEYKKMLRNLYKKLILIKSMKM